LTWRQRLDIMDDDRSALVQQFKTAAKYSAQPIIFESKPLHRLIMKYINDVRCRAVLPSMVQDTDKFFVNYEGKPYSSSNIGRLVRDWFKLNMELNMGTTSLRAVHATEAREAYLKQV